MITKNGRDKNVTTICLYTYIKYEPKTYLSHTSWSMLVNEIRYIYYNSHTYLRYTRVALSADKHAYISYVVVIDEVAFAS